MYVNCKDGKRYQNSGNKKINLLLQCAFVHEKRGRLSGSCQKELRALAALNLYKNERDYYILRGYRWGLDTFYAEHCGYDS